MCVCVRVQICVFIGLCRCTFLWDVCDFFVSVFEYVCVHQFASVCVAVGVCECSVCVCVCVSMCIFLVYVALFVLKREMERENKR